MPSPVFYYVIQRICLHCLYMSTFIYLRQGVFQLLCEKIIYNMIDFCPFFKASTKKAFYWMAPA